MPSSIPVLTRPSKGEIRAAAGRIIPDLIAPELKVLFCGINPGLYSGAPGYHFARPGNRFWPRKQDPMGYSNTSSPAVVRRCRDGHPCRARGYLGRVPVRPEERTLPYARGVIDGAQDRGRPGADRPGATGALGKVAGWATRKASGWRTPERRARQAEIRNWRP